MKKALALALALAFAGTANAGLYCKLEGYSSGLPAGTGISFANSKALEWHWGQAFPSTASFDYVGKDVVCFVDGGMLYNVVSQIGGIPHVRSLEDGTTQGTGSGPQVGVIYRGDIARFLIDNLKSQPYEKQGSPNSGNSGVKLADFAASVKP